MQKIKLSQGKFAIVDDADFPLLDDFQWSYRGERNDGPGYAIRNKKVEGTTCTAYMHRELMNPNKDQEVIFLNYDRLDCRRLNLKVVTKQEARQHHRVRKDSEIGSKGIRFHPSIGNWAAYVCRDGFYRSIGTYDTQNEAEWAYKQEMLRENPDLMKVPERVDPKTIPAACKSNPDQR